MIHGLDTGFLVAAAVKEFLTLHHISPMNRDHPTHNNASNTAFILQHRRVATLREPVVYTPPGTYRAAWLFPGRCQSRARLIAVWSARD
jgi:hypothetical protein